MIYLRIFYALSLFDVFTVSRDLGDIVKSFYLNGFKLLKTGFFLIIVVYFFGFIIYLKFPNEFLDPGPDENIAPTCDTILACFLSTLDYGLRFGGGIGEAMKPRVWTDEGYGWRTFFEMAFYILVNLFIVIMIQGIIIDTFSDLRKKQAELVEAVDSRCLLCDDTKIHYDNKRNIQSSWEDHLTDDHNIFAFLDFLVYLKKRPFSKCDNTERFFKQLIENEDLEVLKEFFKPNPGEDQNEENSSKDS
eukprot:TRINITY_DN8566_c0_g1_i5.p1 TRINITY_DN8566_c0_g1~~TRINITY_DN8566_c0_g1_i5.p1  ORF type:complete len:247 (+),score=33.93 TRINITY_DN8566_c0_g1_i5:80-820(+)